MSCEISMQRSFRRLKHSANIWYLRPIPSDLVVMVYKVATELQAKTFKDGQTICLLIAPKSDRNLCMRFIKTGTVEA